MKLRDLLRKIDDSVRPIHLQGEEPSGSDRMLDGRVAGRAGNFRAAPGPTSSTNWAPSQQDEEPHH